MHRHLPFRAPAAFTLIEMLVTVSLLVILTSLALPGLQRALDTSRTTACVSNLRQVHLAVLAYAGANDQVLPYAYDSRTGLSWDALLGSGAYISSTKINGKYLSPVYGCPVQRKQVGIPNATTYGMNGTLCSATAPRRLSSVEQPSQTLLLADGAGPTGKAFNIGLYQSATVPSTPHRGTANLLFMDGHVEAWKAAAIPFNRYPPGSSQWMLWSGSSN